jgi:hypothetical protein
MKTLVHGFAVSHWQDPQKWDFARFKPSGVELLVARACRGGTSLDTAFASYRRSAREHGLLFGASLELRPGQSAQVQADLFETQVARTGGLRKGDLLPVLQLPESNGRRSTGELNGVVARGVARLWSRRYGGVIVKYSSLFPGWMGAQSPDSSWAWLLGQGIKHWLVDDGASAGRPRSLSSPSWHLHEFGKRSLAEFAGGAIDVDVTTRNRASELSELLIGGQAGVDHAAASSPASLQ